MSSVGRVAGTAMKVGTIAVTGMGVALGGLGISLLNTKQQAQIAFTSMFGDAGKAQAFIKKIQDFAAITPFEFPQLLNAAKNLTVVGVAADRVIPIMRTLGDATSSMGTGAEGIQRAVLALTQMQQKGKITGEEMLQLAEAGVPAWDALATVMGVSVPEAQEKVTKGQGKVNDLFKALEQSAGPALTRVKGMMEAQSQTAAGLFSTLKDTVSQISAQVMEPFFKRAVAGMKQLAEITGTPSFVAGIDKFGRIMEGITTSFISGFGATVIPGLQWFVSNKTVLIGAAVGLGAAFAWTNPVGAALAAGGAIILGLGLMRQKSEDLSPPLLAAQIKLFEMRTAAENLSIPFIDLIGYASELASILGGIKIPTGPTGKGSIGGVNLGSIFSNLKGAVLSQVLPAYGLLNTKPSTSDLLSKQLAGELTASEEKLLAARNAQAAGNKELTDAEMEMAEMDYQTARAAEKAKAQIDEKSKAVEKEGATADKTKEKVLTLAEALQDGLITLAESMELHLTPVMAGTEEALHSFEMEAFRVEEEAFTLTKAIVGLGMAADRGELAFVKFTSTIIKGALDMQRTALASIFGRGTREELTLQLQAAEIDQRLAALDIANAPGKAAIAANIEKLQKEIEQIRGGREGTAESRAQRIQTIQDLIEEAKRRGQDIAPGNEEWQQQVKDYIRAREDEIDAIKRQQDTADKAVDAEVKSREKAIEALQKQTDEMGRQEQQLRDDIGKRITLMQAENQVQQIRAQLADATLINEAEQAAMVLTLTANIRDLSGWTAEAARVANESVVPDFNAAAAAARFVENAFNGAGLAMLSIPGRATGGDVSAGKPYWVGERGVPELFIPGQSGSIIPSAMRGGGTPSTTTYNYSSSFGNVSLPGVTSGEDFLPEVERYLSRKLQYGSRGLPS